MNWQVGDTYPATVTFRDATGALADPTSLTLKVRNPAGTITTAVYPASPVARLSLGSYRADISLTTTGMWVIEFDAADLPQVEGVQVFVGPAPTDGVTFATIDELAIRMGLTFTTAQAAQGAMLLGMVTGLIIECVNRDDTWAATFTPIPRLVRAICLEVVARVMQNPAGARSESETIGQYQHSTSYTDGSSGLYLTAAEEVLCRRAILGATSGSAQLDSIVTQFAEALPMVDWDLPIDTNPDIYEDVP
jgi:hypothetical protein